MRLHDDARTVDGSDGLSIGRGDLIQTRRNDAEVGVTNRQTWFVQRVDFGPSVIYYVTDGEGIDVADAHEKRSPVYWKHPIAN